MFAGDDVTGAQSRLTLETVCELMCRGGWLGALEDKIDMTRMKKPAFKMILVADGDYAYRRKKDDVLVCPIGCLRDYPPR